MNIARFLQICAIGCLLLTDSGCGRAAYLMWDYILENHGWEAFQNVVIARAGRSGPLGPPPDISPPGGTESVGVVGRMPKAVTISFASKDKRRHCIYVVIPPRPGGYGSQTPSIYFVIESRCKAIATWKDPEDRGWRRWYYTVRNHSADKVSALKAIYGHHTSLLTDEKLNADLATWLAFVNLAPDPLPEAVEVTLISPDGTRHSVRVALPAVTHKGAPWPRVHLLVHSNGGVTAKCTYPDPIKPPQRWFCAVGDNGRQAFSNLTVIGHGKSYPLGTVGPKSDAALSALGRMPGALEVGFVSHDGRRHKVHIAVPPVPAGHGGQSPELYLVIANAGKVVATYTCPAVLVGVVWSYGIGTHLNERFTDVVVTYKGSVNAPWRLGAIAPGGANAAPPVIGPMPKAVDVSFTSPDGKRHKVHVILPPTKAVREQGLPEVDLEIEKGGKVTAGWWQ